jgi:hypothetical protein
LNRKVYFHDYAFRSFYYCIISNVIKVIWPFTVYIISYYLLPIIHNYASSSSFFAYLIQLFVSLVILSVIPQTCRYKSKKYECGLSISCVLSGGQPMDLCSGGMIWSCCVDKASPPQDHDSESSPQTGSLNNASK